MNQPDANADDPTRSWKPAVSPLPESFAPERQVIEGSSSELADETRDLLHRRLRAASLMLALGFGVFLLRDLYFPKILQQLTYLHCLVFSPSGSQRPGLIGSLETLDAAASPAGAGHLRDCRGLLHCQPVHRPSNARSARPAHQCRRAGSLQDQHHRHTHPDLHLRDLHPQQLAQGGPGDRADGAGTARRAVLLGLTSPSFLSVSEEARTLDKLTENALYLLLGAVTAILGTHTINTVRCEEFRARRLNQYHLTKKLGAGGMGEVYLAEHQLLKRPCAVKLIRPSLSQKPRVLARFELEVRATARLSHWNTVEVFDYGRTDDGTFYYVMEYLPGLSLQELVDRHGPLPPGRIIYLLCQACDALREAHQAGLIHRDLKPPNVFAAYRGGATTWPSCSTSGWSSRSGTRSPPS